MKPNIDALIVSGDAAQLAEVARQFLGVDVEPKEFLKACRLARKRAQDLPLGTCNGYESWSECTWRCWLRYRYQEIVPPVPGCPVDSRYVSAVFHVSFLGVVETPEHIANLTRTPEEIIASHVARSKIGSTDLIIRPIDATAARVV
jgi:hypothetical protein